MSFRRCCRAVRGGSPVKLYASCSSYTLGQMVGTKEAARLIQAAVSDVEHEQLIPAVHALRELRELGDLALRVDGGATNLGRSRSRHFAAALESDCDAWVTLDDDIDTTRETLALMLAAIESDEPRICFAPYTERTNHGVALVEWAVPKEERVSGVRSAVRGGFGCVAVNRAALIAVANVSPVWFDDVDNQRKPGPFYEILEGEKWYGEDFSFYRRARPVARIEALTSGEVTHAGVRLDLSVLKGS